MIKEHENLETKDFTIFVNEKKWVNTAVKPLLELCSRDNEDSAADKFVKIPEL
jgi:hypothetical protein